MDQEEYAALSKAAYEFGVEKYSAVGAVDRFLRLINGTEG